MSINIDHPNEDISTSAGSPPSLGSQAPLVANDATVTANSSGNVSRYVMETAVGASGTEDGANTWAKIATFTPSASNFQYATFTYRVEGSFQNANIASSATISINLTQGTTGLDSTNSSIDIETKGTGTALSADNFKLVSASATNGTAVELWMKKNSTSNKFWVYELAKANYSNWAIAYNSGAAWQSTDPATGAAVVVTSDWAKPTRVAWTPVVYGATTAGTGTYTSQAGYYWEKDGFIEFILVVIWTAHTGTGNMMISGLPKASAAGATTPVIIGQSTISTSYPTAYISNASSEITVFDGSANETISATGTLRIGGRYAV